MLRVVVMVSGGGTNLQAIIDRVADGTITNRACRIPGGDPAGDDCKIPQPYDQYSSVFDPFLLWKRILRTEGT